MNRSQRQIGLILGLVLLLAAGLVLLTQAARAQLPQSAAQAPATQTGMVPTFQIDPLKAEPADQRTATITQITLDEHTVDIAQLGLRPLDHPLPLSSGQPDGSTIGVGNAIMVASPDVVSQSTANAIGTLLANFSPSETVTYYLNGAVVGNFVADANGRVAVGINTGVGIGFLTMEGIGQISGKRAGTVAQVLDAAPPVPGFAAAPHAVNQTITGTFYAYGARFIASSVVTLTRNGVTLGTAATNANGRFFVSLTPPNGANTSAVYAAVTTTVGSMSGSSVEERSDAGTPPLGDQNPSRGFVDRPVINAGTGGTVGLVGEGFQPGETITLSGCAAGTVPADANGAAGVFLVAPAGAGIFNCIATGGISGRVARASFQAAANAINAPSAINQPSSLPVGATNFTFLYDRLVPTQTGTIFVDGTNRGPATTNAGGYGSVVLTAPLSVGIHSVSFIGASGQVAIAPLYIMPQQGTPTPTAIPSVTATRTGTATATRTVTPSGGATATPCFGDPIGVQGAITTGDPTQTGRLFRDGIADTCAVPGTCGAPIAGSYHYDVFTYTNSSGVSVCVNVNVNTACAGTNFIYSGAYLGSFNPANICQNWLADLGSSPNGTPLDYSFTVPAGATFVVNVHEVTANAGCSAYTLTITGLQGSCATATPTVVAPTATRTVTPPAATNTATRTVTPVSATNTPVSATNTPGVPPTNTPGGATNTPVSATNTPGGATATLTAGPTSTPCTITFTDVDVNNPFYAFIRCLACRQIVSGYSDGTFRWGNEVTRGQLSKIISGAAGQNNSIPSTQQTFEDVPNSNVFWVFIERLAGVGAISGYTCGGPGEPCVPPGNRPYFRWGANATRGQISKITAVTAGWNGPIPTTQQTFEDVDPTNPFWTWIEELASRSIISGYTCGGLGEPCVPPQNRPYFRWGANATRGQMSKIAALAFFPGCTTPARPAASDR